MRLKPKHGYWQIDNYPIGGSFARSDDNGLEIDNVMSISPPIRGCNAFGYTKEGKKIAFSLENTIQN
jgi:hypothetical protein